MKQNVLHILDENYDFSNNLGHLSFSTDFVEMAFDVDEIREGSFRIWTSSDTEMKGYVLSNHARMKCSLNAFEGKDAEIFYEFDSTGMEPGDVVKGEFQIISNKGEYRLAFEATMQPGYLYSSLGHIKNLFHFANLAKTNWAEAVSLYYSDRFIELLTGSDSSYRTLYRGLSSQSGNEQCLDEFLVAVKKKDRIFYQVKQNSFRLGEVREELYKEIELEKNSWGFVSGTVSANAPFIRLEKSSFRDDDFIGNVCKLPFYVDVEELHYGRNHAVICIETTNTIIEVEVEADYTYIPPQKNENYIWKEKMAALLRKYLMFRMGKITKAEWVRESEIIAAQVNANPDAVTFAKLYRVQLLLAEEKVQDASWMLEKIEAEMLQEKQYPEVYGYFLYLTTHLNKDEDYINKVSQKVKKLYNKERENAGLSWLMLYLREDLFYHPEKKWDFLEECYHHGIYSPLLHVEALQLLREMPVLLSKLDEYEYVLLRFAKRHEALTPEIAERLQFLGERKKNYEKRWYDIFTACYEIAPSKEMLQTICSYLMKASCVGPEYFPWYQKAVLAELKLTRLYEYFVQSVDLDDMRELPLLIMMYFSYQNNLDYERMAYLHVNVLKHKAKFPEIAASYAERLPEFVASQISQGRISEHLAILYREVMREHEFDVKLANDYAKLLFVHEIHVGEEYTSVAIVNEHFLGEKEVPVCNGKAYLPIYGRKYHIFGLDRKRNRTILEHVRTRVLLFEQKLYDKMLPMVHENDSFLLHHCEADKMFVSISPENEVSYARLLRSKETTFTYKKEVLVALVKFYFDNDYIRELDELLLEVNPEILGSIERGELIHILVARGMYALAFEWLCIYGTEHAEKKDVLRLCSRLLERGEHVEEGDMLRMCSYLYRVNRYDPNILNYLVLHFNGTIRETRALLKDCDSFGIDTYILLERLLIQTLFTGVYLNEKYHLYESYMKSGGNSDIEKAFLARCAYDYFVSESIVEDVVLKRMETLLEEKEELNRVTRLAYLKSASKKDKSEWNLSLIEETIRKELERDAEFPFFRVFANEIPDLIPFTDRAYVEYRGECESRVIMHYAIEHENGIDTEYRKEELKNMFAGIFVKSFLLFYGESIQYYITEENGNREQLTQSSVVERTEDELGEHRWKYTILNEAAIAGEMNDYKSCEENLYECMKKEYVLRKVFR